MKKITTLLLLASMMGSNCIYAQPETTHTQSETCAIKNCRSKKEMSEQPPCQPPCCQPCPKKEFAWAIGAGGLAVIATVVGFTASMASGN